MIRTTGQHKRRKRWASATVELAILLPVLAFLFAIAVDYARIFYFAVTLENCARNGAYFASNYPNNSYVYSDIYGYKTLDEAVLADASNLWTPPDTTNKPTWTIEYADDEDGPYSSAPAPTTEYVKVTVYWTFRSITSFPAIPSSVNLARTVTMKVAPAMPDFSPGGSGSG